MNYFGIKNVTGISRNLTQTFLRRYAAKGATVTSSSADSSVPEPESIKKPSKSKKRIQLEATYNNFPEKFLRKKHKTPSAMYVADAEGAAFIAKKTLPFLRKKQTIVEVNPGPGYLTKEFLRLDEHAQKIILIENVEFFLGNLEELHSVYPDRVKVKHGDFINLWKLAFRDKIDNGNRVPDLLSDVPKSDFTKDSNVALFAAVGSYNFFKHLINNLVFQTSFLSYGRYEMFLLVPPPIYIHLTCRNEIGYMLYRATSILFQIMFEYKFIDKVSRHHFLPRQGDYNLTKGNKLTRVNSIDPGYLYLVKIKPRKNLYELCPREHMNALWFFVKQSCVSRRNRIIPNLEKLIPACGPRLIVNPNKPINVENVFKNDATSLLPKFSHPCTTMSTRDYYPHMNIYTQFGDLSPSQILTLFSQFRSWPEYDESSFLASMEICLLKMESSSDESVDGLEITEDDDSVGEEADGVHVEDILLK